MTLLAAGSIAACADGASKTPPASVAKITIEPTGAATPIEPDAPVVVRVADGRLTTVEMREAHGGTIPDQPRAGQPSADQPSADQPSADQPVPGQADRPVPGRFSADQLSWRPAGPLKASTGYTIRAQAVDAKGLVAVLDTTLTTVKADKLIKTAVAPLNGETVGVGQPIAVRFSGAVAKGRRAAVERALRVTSTPAATGGWFWVDDTQLRYRPRKFWPSGVEVELDVGITGIRTAPGAYGDETRTVRFTVGSSMISTVDIDRHTMAVSRDGTVIRQIPITTGRAGDETRTGTKVVLEKLAKKRMDGVTVGIDPSDPDYYNLDVSWAVRVTNSGEFVHAAPWSRNSQGRENISHGCVGMSDADARWYFDNTRRGDVVKVVGNRRKPMELNNGFGDWNLSWASWKAGSALG